MKLTRVFLFICLFFGIVNTIYSQHPISIHLTEKEGLPDIEFYDMAEDKKGFLWLACNKGLYRYDGREFKNYSHPEKRGLSVFNLKFDNKNRLWCTNVTGQFFYVEENKLKLFYDTSKDLKIEQLHTFKIYKNKLVAHAKNNCFKINLNTNKLTVLGSSLKNTYHSSVEKNDTLFFLKSNPLEYKIKYLTENSDVLKEYLKINSNTKAVILKTSNNNLIYQQVNTDKVPTRSIIKKDKIVSIEDTKLKQRKLINSFYQEDNNFWFLTEKGVEVFKVKDSLETLERIHHYFPKRNITKVVKDKQNNYWFSSLRNGVFVIPNIHINSYSFKENIGNITAIENVNNTHIYFGTTLGWLGIYNIKDKTTKYKHFNTAGPKIRHILHNKNFDDVYVASDLNNGNYLIDAKTQSAKKIRDKVYFGGAKSMVLLDDKYLFSSLINVHAFLTLSKGTIVKREVKYLRNKRVYNTFFNPDNKNIYIANVDELVVYDSNFNPSYIRYKSKPIFARGITQTKDGIIWISTFKDGVLTIKDNKVLKSYSTKNGLLSNQTSYIQADGNNVWITTEDGLQYLNTTTNTFKNLTRKDGIESFNINGIEIIGNTVWYSSNLGLFSFDKTKVFKPKKLINPYFTTVSIGDSIHTIKDNYKVSYKDKRIAITFNSNTFQSLKNTSYQYKLVGLNKSWQNVPKGVNEVVFNSLEQGKYIFQLRTSNNDKFSEVEQIKFNVKGVYYKQWWFILLASVLGISYVAFYMSKKNKREKEQQRLEIEQQHNELEKVMLKLENLRSQMNPHFIFNALNSIQDYILNNEKGLARTFLVKFSRLIRMYLEHSQKNTVTLEEELTALNLYLELEKVRFEDSFMYEVLVSEKIGTKHIKIPAFLVQPYVENAIKHGLLHKTDNRQLFVNFTLNSNQDTIHISIDDNGIGREASQIINSKKIHKPTSFSSQANVKRIALINKARRLPIKLNIVDKTNDNQESIGTLVEIEIPLEV